MSVWLFLSILIVSAGAVAGESQGVSQELSVQTGELPQQPSIGASAKKEGLTPDTIFHVLAGEIAIQRSELDLAFSHQLQVAKEAKDAVAAQRSARIAMHQKRYTDALDAVSLWIQLEPDNLNARRIGVIASLRLDRSEEALPHLVAIVKISSASDEGGFLDAVTTLMVEKDHQKSLEVVRRLSELFPEDSMRYYGVALMALMAKQYDEAQEAAAQFLQERPQEVRAYTLMSRILIVKEQADEAEQVIKKALQRFPKEQSLRTLYARLLVEQKELSRAYDEYLKIRELTPEASDVHLSLGVLALELKRNANARQHFKRLIEMGRNVDKAHFFLGQAEQQEGNTEQALLWYKKVKRGERWIAARSEIAKLLAESGRPDQAREHFIKLRHDAPDHAIEIYLIEGEQLRSRGEMKTAIELYDQALTEHPDDSKLLYSRAIFYASQGDVGRAESDLRRVLESTPEDADALNALGYTLTDLTDRHQEAYGYIKRALQLKPDSAAILDSMGWVQYRLGKVEEALSYLRQAYQILQDAEIAAHLGELLWVTGGRDEAQKIWREALDEEPESPYLQETMQRLTEQ